MANLLTALREGDFSTRARGANRDEPLGDVMSEINLLGGVLQEQRLGALEATALLRTVMEEIDVAIFAFDGNETLRLVNRAGQELVGQPAERILGREAKDLDMSDCLTGEATRVLNRTFPGGAGRWGMRRTMFREGGLPHSLVVIADLSQPLREEELKAWQRLVRVIGHELNNSLAPIKSIAGSLTTMLRRTPKAPDWEEDMIGGLEIIEARAEGLNRFMQSYARLAKLPPPTKLPVQVGSLLRRVVSLETRTTVAVVEGPDIVISADAAQLEQVFINLVKNAVEARPEGGQPGEPTCCVRAGWRTVPGAVEIFVEDDGPGIANSQNLFVPFFTTKPSGSGIGLVLCRQIAENHGGSLTLENRTDATGCIARMRLPL
jgi:PAS domain S-box-containing protein